jgi:hypothetical protein
MNSLKFLPFFIVAALFISLSSTAQADCAQCTEKFDKCMSEKDAKLAKCLMHNTDCTNKDILEECKAEGIVIKDYDVVPAADPKNPCRQCTNEYEACIKRGVEQAQCLMSDTVCTDHNRKHGCAAKDTH